MTEKDALRTAQATVILTDEGRPVALTFAEAVALLAEAAAADAVRSIHKPVGFDIDDEGTLDPDNDCCDYCSEREGEAVIYPCDLIRAMNNALAPRNTSPKIRV